MIFRKHAILIFLFVGLVISNFGCDQISKLKVRSSLAKGEVIEIFGEYFVLTHAENKGAFLGLGSELSPVFRLFLLQLIPAFAIFYMGFIAVKRLNSGIVFVIGMGFALGGGIGNIYDRIITGSVTDFLILDLGLIRTGIFNMADTSVLIGLLLLLYHILFLKSTPTKPLL